MDESQTPWSATVDWGKPWTVPSELMIGPHELSVTLTQFGPDGTQRVVQLAKDRCELRAYVGRSGWFIRNPRVVRPGWRLEVVYA
jgi:hypothetical protein